MRIATLVVTAAFLLASGAAMACPMQASAKSQDRRLQRQQHPDPGQDLDRSQPLAPQQRAGPLRSAVHRTLGCIDLSHPGDGAPA